MQFNPWRCPECGQAARGTIESVRGLALLAFDGQGNAEYEGETELDWDSQVTVHDADSDELATLECPGGHQWFAAIQS
jgi:hypothetical protein